MQPILVTAAAGKIGGAVATELLAKGVPVRALVRSADARSERLRAAGAEIVVGDLYAYDDLLAALHGVERAFYCPPMEPTVIQSATAFALAAQETGVRSIVGLTQWLANPQSPSVLTRQHWLIDRLFARIPGITLTIVNPGFFADNILQYTIGSAAHLGRYPWPYGDSLNAPPSNEDIAAVAVAALLDPERHDGFAYRPTGPKLISGQDVVDTLSRVFERRVALMPLSEEMFLKAVRAAGFPPFMLVQMHTYNDEQRKGAFAYNAPTDHVLRATGREPESFEATVRRYAAHPSLQPTFANKLKAVGDFLKIIVTPAPDLARIEREMALPIARRSRFSIEDERWLAEHRPQAGAPRFMRPERAAALPVDLDRLLAEK
jgi:uncharacterized protein YbjT (DUF2867 family)